VSTPKTLRYAKTHEWVRPEGETAVVGISDYAQEALGDIVYVELPALNEHFAQGEEVATIESVKAASPIYMPVSGTIAEINGSLEGKPESINQSPYEAFLFKVRLDDPAQIEKLLDADAYLAHVEQEKAAH
jgi:glycine cleavage system H protein